MELWDCSGDPQYASLSTSVESNLLLPAPGLHGPPPGLDEPRPGFMPAFDFGGLRACQPVLTCLLFRAQVRGLLAGASQGRQWSSHRRSLGVTDVRKGAGALVRRHARLRTAALTPAGTARYFAPISLPRLPKQVQELRCAVRLQGLASAHHIPPGRQYGRQTIAAYATRPPEFTDSAATARAGDRG